MIFALERLRALRANREGNAPESVSLTPSNLPMEWRIEFEERAAILEYDGGLSRDEADRQALNEIAERIERTGGGRPSEVFVLNENNSDDKTPTEELQ